MEYPLRTPWGHHCGIVQAFPTLHIPDGTCRALAGDPRRLIGHAASVAQSGAQSPGARLDPRPAAGPCAPHREYVAEHISLVLVVGESDPTDTHVQEVTTPATQRRIDSTTTEDHEPTVRTRRPRTQLRSEGRKVNFGRFRARPIRHSGLVARAPILRTLQGRVHGPTLTPVTQRTPGDPPQHRQAPRAIPLRSSAGALGGRFLKHRHLARTSPATPPAARLLRQSSFEQR